MHSQCRACLSCTASIRADSEIGALTAIYVRENAARKNYLTRFRHFTRDFERIKRMRGASKTPDQSGIQRQRKSAADRQRISRQCATDRQRRDQVRDGSNGGAEDRRRIDCRSSTTLRILPRGGGGPSPSTTLRGLRAPGNRAVDVSPLGLRSFAEEVEPGQFPLCAEV